MHEVFIAGRGHVGCRIAARERDRGGLVRALVRRPLAAETDPWMELFLRQI